MPQSTQQMSQQEQQEKPRGHVIQARRPKAIVFDILGTASKSGFLERILFPFLKVNLESYINQHWNVKEFVKLFKKIQDQSIEFNKQEPSTPIVLAHETSQAKASLMNFINFVTDNGVNSTAITQLRFKVWFEGYQQAKLKTPIYADVPNRIKIWFAEGIKFYVFSNTWVEAQKALLRNTNHGDLTNLISAHFDNEFGLLTEADSWRRLCYEIRESPNDVLFLTKSPQEGRAAADAGLAVVLVLTHRHNVKAITAEDRERFPYVRTLNDLQWLEGSMLPASENTGGGSRSPQPGVPMPTALSGKTGASAPILSGGQSHSAMPTSATHSTMPTGTTRSALQTGTAARPSHNSATTNPKTGASTSTARTQTGASSSSKPRSGSTSRTGGGK